MIQSDSENQNKAWHAFNLRDRYFLLDIEKSFLYTVSRAAFLEIKKTEGEPLEDTGVSLPEKLAAKLEWRRLKGKLRPLSEAERAAEEQRLGDIRPDLAGLWLGVSHVCNLACEYCFANEPAYLGRNKLMTEDVALRGVDYLLEHCGENKNLSLTFFGGEPLMNMPVIDRVVIYCRKKEKTTGKKFNFAMTTNGTLLTPEVFERLRGYGIYPMISMDGTPAIHNRFRPTKSNQPSWDIIVRNLKGIPEFHQYLAVRATAVDDDTDLVESLECLRSVGFRDIRICGLCPNSGLELDGNDFRMDVWQKRYLELMDYALAGAEKLDNLPESGMHKDALALKNRHRSYFCCSTGRYYYYLDPDADLYPCFRLMTPDRKEKIGSLDEPFDPERSRVFMQSNVLATSCYECWARYLCGGPCFGDAFATTGDYTTPHAVQCEQRKFKLMCAAYVLDHFQRKGDEQDES